MKSILLLVSSIYFMVSACTQNVPVDNIKAIPDISEFDHKYADVFKLLDGTWKGEFLIYEDPNPGKLVGERPKNLTKEQVQNENFKLINSIQVQQEYTSISPYFQRVKITDTYPDSGKVEVSEGVNKIQGGTMWCVVHKPNEKVIHMGKAEGDDTIIWYQNKAMPQRVEYFQEKVGEKYYEIMGYGYYESDDLTKTPKLWFYSKYKKQ